MRKAFSVYSCGGSSGFTTRHKPCHLPDSLFIPIGNRHPISHAIALTCQLTRLPQRDNPACCEGGCPFKRDRIYVCTGRCSPKLLHVAGNRSYISTPLIDTRVVAILGLRSHRILIAGRVQVDRLVRQILGGVSFRSMQSVYNKFLCDRDCSRCQSRPHSLAYRMPTCV